MKATEFLSSEHRLIERVLCALETAAWLLSLEETIRPDFFSEAADFIAGFADEAHHKKEEGILFRRLVGNGIEREGNYIDAMLHEHEMGRAYTRALRLAAERLKAGDQTARLDVIQNSRHYATLLHNHIGIEDQILYPLADRLIPPQQQEALWQEVAKIEQMERKRGIHQKYQALADELEREMEI